MNKNSQLSAYFLVYIKSKLHVFYTICILLGPDEDWQFYWASTQTCRQAKKSAKINILFADLYK